MAHDFGHDELKKALLSKNISVRHPSACQVGTTRQMSLPAQAAAHICARAETHCLPLASVNQQAGRSVECMIRAVLCILHSR